MSSAVEWSACSWSARYRPWSLATTSQHGRVAQKIAISLVEPKAPAPPQKSVVTTYARLSPSQVGDHQAAGHQPDPALEIGAAQQRPAVIVHRGDQVAGDEGLAAGGSARGATGGRRELIWVTELMAGSMNGNAPRALGQDCPQPPIPVRGTGGYLTLRSGQRGQSWFWDVGRKLTVGNCIRHRGQ